MADLDGTAVCDRCRIVYNPYLGDEEFNDGLFTEDDREYDLLCAQCYDVVVQGEEKPRVAS